MSRLLLKVFLLFLPVMVYPETFVYKKFYINYNYEISQKNIIRLTETLERAEDFFIYKSGFIPKNNFDIFIFKSVNEMMDTLHISSWVGAYYNDNKVWFQPLETLLRKDVFEKVIFIEYAHYYLNEYTKGNCPAWLNEMLSAYYFYQFKNEAFVVKKDIKALMKFSDLTLVNKIFSEYDFSRSFYSYSYLFASFLNRKYENFFENFLKLLSDGENLSNAVNKITGKTMEYLYEKEFIVEVLR